MAASLSVRESVSETATAPAQSGIPVLQVSGRLDASTVSILEHALTRALNKNARAVIVELSEVNYISSSGLRVLLTARRRARERGGDLFLCALSQNVRDVFDMVGFTALFSVSSSIQDAVQASQRLQTGTS